MSSLVGEFAPGEYTMKSAGFLGGKLVLSTGELSLLGENDELSRDLPVTVVRVTQFFFGIRVGRDEYIVTQPGGRMLEMIKGTADDIVHVIQRA